MADRIPALAIAVVTAAAPLLAQRFDNVVRADFFAGFRGDRARLARGMETCEKTLAADPDDAAALVWHGSGLLFASGDKFNAGDWRGGLDLQKRGLAEMDRAVKLRPDDLQTRIPRGATLLAAAPHFRNDREARSLIQTAIGDYEKAEQVQRGAGSTQSPHSRGELLGGLALGYRLTGNRALSEKYLQRIVAELPGTPYETKAKAWLANPDGVKKTDRFCLGCHE